MVQVAVVGTGSLVGGNYAIDQCNWWSREKDLEAEKTELQLIVREEVRAAIKEA